MMVHRLLDVLTHHPSPKFNIAEGADKDTITSLIRQAEKFDFGRIVLEPTPDTSVMGYPQWQVPKLTPEEKGFIREGLVPLPAKLCWYEFTLNDYASGFLIKDDGAWSCTRVDYDRGPSSGVMDGIWVKEADGGASIEMYGNMQLIYGIHKMGKIGEKLISDMGYKSNIELLQYLTLMLNSKTTHVEYVAGKPKGSAIEASSKREPKYEHRVVTIVPKEYLVESRGGSHASPRLHWRRSHLRHYKTPSGEVYHRVVIQRVLVGKAELGEISHEYRIK